MGTDPSLRRREIPMRRPSRLTVPACTALALLAGGCGSGSGASSTSTAAAPSRATASTANADLAGPTRSTFASFARRVNLRPADVPGFQATAREKHPSLHLGAFEHLGSCASTPELKPLERSTSARFVAGHGLYTASVSSSVEMMASAGALKKETAATMALLRKPAAVACLRRKFDTQGRKAGSISVAGHTIRITLSGLGVAPVEIPPPSGASAAGGVSLRFTADYSVPIAGATRTVPVTFFYEVLTFAVGRAQVTLATMASGAPFPQRRETGLLALLASRATGSAPGAAT